MDGWMVGCGGMRTVPAGVTRHRYCDLVVLLGPSGARRYRYISYGLEVVGFPTGMTTGHAEPTPEFSKMAETEKPRLVGRGSRDALAACLRQLIRCPRWRDWSRRNPFLRSMPTTRLSRRAAMHGCHTAYAARRSVSLWDSRAWTWTDGLRERWWQRPESHRRSPAYEAGEMAASLPCCHTNILYTMIVN